MWQTQKLKLQQNLKTQIVTKLKNPNCEKQNKKLILTKLKKTQKLKLWQNSKAETETKHKNFKCDKVQKLKFWQN